MLQLLCWWWGKVCKPAVSFEGHALNVIVRYSIGISQGKGLPAHFKGIDHVAVDWKFVWERYPEGSWW